jgi:hypothetical protein
LPPIVWLPAIFDVDELLVKLIDPAERVSHSTVDAEISPGTEILSLTVRVFVSPSITISISSEYLSLRIETPIPNKKY